MKIVSILLLVVWLIAGCANSAENKTEPPGVAAPSASETDTEISVGSQTTQTEPILEENEMKIIINGSEFSAKLCGTKAAEEFKAMLPMTLDMSELNGNEKYFYLDSRLSAESENVGRINKGDIMLYGSNCVVLFYERFSTPYSYTRIGSVENPDGLEKAVGAGNITVKFE